MPVLTGLASVDDGAQIDGRVGWSNFRTRQAQRAFRPVPPPADLKALIDTGASASK